MEGEEYDHRDKERQKGRTGQDVPVLATRVDQVGDLHGQHRMAGEENLGHQEIIPYPDELEDTQRGNGGHRQGQGQASECRPVAGAVQVGRFEDLTRQGADEISDQVNGIWQSKTGMEKPDPQEGALDAKL